MSVEASDVEIAWVAGFLEGEGWFAYRDQRSGGRTTMRVGCNQVNREPLERLQELFGGTIGFKRQDPKVRRSWWGWEIRNQEMILELTALITPWLTKERRERIPWSVT